MANELKHVSVGTQLTQAEYELITGHQFNNGATGDLPYGSSATQISRLAIGSAGQFLWVTGGIPAWRTLVAGDLPAHGAAEHTNVTREIFLPVPGTYLAAGTQIAAHGNRGGVEGGANADAPDVYFAMKTPTDFVSFTKLEAVVIKGGAGANMYWRLTARYAANGEANNTHEETPALGATAIAGPNTMVVTEPTNVLSLASLAIGDILGIRFFRNGVDALDTLNDVLELYGLLFTYVASQ